MASSAKEKKIARDYYKSHAKYRREKIEDRKEYYHEHQKSQNAYAREYYRKNPSYRKYKIKYAVNYRKSHSKSK